MTKVRSPDISKPKKSSDEGQTTASLEARLTPHENIIQDIVNEARRSEWQRDVPDWDEYVASFEEQYVDSEYDWIASIFRSHLEQRKKTGDRSLIERDIQEILRAAKQRVQQLDEAEESVVPAVSESVLQDGSDSR